MKKFAKVSAMLLAIVALFVPTLHASAKVVDATYIEAITADDDISRTIYTFGRYAFIGSISYADFVYAANGNAKHGVTDAELLYKDGSNAWKDLSTGSTVAKADVELDLLEIFNVDPESDAVQAAAADTETTLEEETVTERPVLSFTDEDDLVTVTFIVNGEKTNVKNVKIGTLLSKVIEDNDMNNSIEHVTVLSWKDADNNSVDLTTAKIEESATFTAVTETTKYTVSYVDPTGKIYDAVEVQYNTLLTTVPAPAADLTKVTFKGWFDSEDNQVTANSLTVTKDVTLTAKYTVKVTYVNSVNDSTILEDVVEYGEASTAPTNIKRTGYTLSWDKEVSEATENTTVTTVWTEKTQKVVLNRNTATTDTTMNDELEITFGKVGKNLVSIETLGWTKTGYTFAGWSTTSDGTVEYADEATISDLDEDLVLYAVWNADTHKVILYQNVSTADMTLDDTTTVTYDAAATNIKALPWTRTGYTFKGWSTTRDGKVLYKDQAEVSNLTEDLVLYAIWELGSWTIKFDANATTNAPATGTMSDINYSYSVNAQQVAIPANTITRTGYTFVGWDTNQNAVTPTYTYTPLVDTITYDIAAGAQTDVTLYAIWTAAKTFTVNTYYNAANGNRILVKTQTVDYGTNATAATAAEVNAEITSEVTEPTEILVLNDNTNTLIADSYKDIKANKDIDIKKVGQWAVEVYDKDPDTTGAIKYATIYVIKGKLLDSKDLKAVLTAQNLPESNTHFVKWMKDNAAAASTVWVVPTDALTADLKLYPEFAHDTYTVSFDSNGGSAVADYVVDLAINTTPATRVAVEPANPTMTGYTFAGWYSDEELTSAYNFATEVTSNITLYAKWVVNQYTVTFAYTDLADVKVDYNSKVTQPADPTLDDMIFVGWYKEDEFDNEFDFDAEVITNATTIYAKFIPATYTVTFNSNGGSAVASQTVNYNATATRPEDPTKTGSTFNKWVLSSDGTTEYEFTENVTANVTLKALWTTNQYTATFDLDGGNCAKCTEQKVNYNKTFTNPTETPVRTGYTFKEWQVDGVLYDFATKATKDITITAVWTQNKTTVSFNLNGGTVTDAIADQVVLSGNTITEPTVAPTRTGLTFAYWSTSATGDEYDFTAPLNTEITNDTVTLYAVYYATVDVVGQAGLTTTYGDIIVGKANALSDKLTAQFKTAVTGYTFAGWYTDNTYTTPFDTTAALTSNETVYGNWTENTYTLNINHFGSNTLNVTKKYTDEIVLASVDTDLNNHKGYTFQGYATEEGGEVVYAPNATVSKLVTSGTVTLYGVWTSAWNYTINFDANTGTGTQAAINTKFGETVTLPSGDDVTLTAPAGKVFDGWTTTKNDENTKVTSIKDYSGITENNGSVTLYAYWVGE